MLEASAGTGKTHTIAALAARYVAEGVARIDELMLVTFGRAATVELRERVRERLVGAAAALADPAHARAATTRWSALLATGSADEVDVRRRAAGARARRLRRRHHRHHARLLPADARRARASPPTSTPT